MTLAETLRTLGAEVTEGPGGASPTSLTRAAVPPERLVTAAAALRDAGFRYYSFAAGVDRGEAVEVVHRVLDLGGRQAELRVLAAGNRLPSLVPIWAGADWHEREVYDLFGVAFDGHPDLRRILLPDDWEGHPLRKSYPLGGPWAHRGNVHDIYPNPPESASVEGGYARSPLRGGAPSGPQGAASPAPAAYAVSAGSDVRNPGQLTGVPTKPPASWGRLAGSTFTLEPGPDGREEMTLNMGPQHPATHGVLRLILRIAGEEVRAAQPDIGYLHTAFEKLAESRSYVQYVPILDRTDYLAAMANTLVYCLAVEKLAGLETTRRTDYLRVFTAEMQRVASHLVWLGTWGLDLGGALGGGTSLWLYCFRERELILDLFEELTGSRMMYHFNTPGGVRYDLPAGYDRRALAAIAQIEARISEYEALFGDNAIFRARTDGIGRVTPELAMAIGASGPVLRGTGVPYDIRVAEPHSSYQEFGVRVATAEGGDCRASYLVRIAEMREALRLARAAIEGLPEGPLSTRRAHTLPKALKPPKGEVYVHIESPRGELGCYLVSDGSPTPYRMKWRAPSFSNLALIPYIAPGHKIADLVAIIGSLDPVFGEVDR